MTRKFNDVTAAMIEQSGQNVSDISFIRTQIEEI